MVGERLGNAFITLSGAEEKAGEAINLPRPPAIPDVPEEGPAVRASNNAPRKRVDIQRDINTLKRNLESATPGKRKVLQDKLEELREERQALDRQQIQPAIDFVTGLHRKRAEAEQRNQERTRQILGR